MFPDRPTRERIVAPTLPVPPMMTSAHNPNRSLVRIFCLSLGGLLSVYTAIAVYGLFQPENISTARIGDRCAPHCAGAGCSRRAVPLGLVR